MKKESKIDVAVLLIFFVRTKLTVQVFEQIRKARPSKLFLYQDGPRSGRTDDIENITNCRNEIESRIDWNCEVYRMYQEKNCGCDPSEYIAQRWMFSIVDKGIVLEDDDVPSQSFFPFCKELLDKYEHDERINMICGMNNLETYDSPDDYFFSQTGSIWGWASWRRVVQGWDVSCDFLDDAWALKLLKGNFGGDYYHIIKTWKKHRNSGKVHYETILGSNAILNHRLNIVPTKNLISNIGLAEETTHGVASIELLPRGLRRIFYQKTYEFKFPLKHPNYIVDNIDYYNKLNRVMRGGLLNKLFMLRKIEGRLYRIFPFFGKV